MSASWQLPSAVRREPLLHGRRSECEALDRLLQRAREGQSQVLVMRGESGVGKTALLEYLVGKATGFRIARAAGAEVEMQLAFAGLHQLCRPMLVGPGGPPDQQRDALAVTFGLSCGAAPDRFLVSLAGLRLLSEAAQQQPLLCVIDDAQWLDRASAQVLAFVARRLLANPIALVFAVREPSETEELAGLAELVVGSLSDVDARALFDSVTHGPMDERVRDRILAEAGGNPMALLELSRGLTPAGLAGGVGLPDTMPLASRIERSFIRQIPSLPAETRRWLLVAAAEPIGDVPLLWRAAERLGIAPGADCPAVAAGLIHLGLRARFRHPLVRSAVCRAASAAELQAVHRALADATDPEADPDRRAWHRAQGAVGRDETAALELERRALGVRGRGGVAAAAAFLARATELTPDSAGRSTRALAAAQASLDAAATDAVLELLAIAEIGPLDALQRARAERLRAELSFAKTRGADAPPSLLDAAGRLAPLDAELARETYLETFGAAIFAGRQSRGRGVRGVAEDVRAAPLVPRSPRPADLLLDGLATRFTEPFTAAVQPLKQALQAFAASDAGNRDTRALWQAARVAPDVWDDERWHELATRAVRLAREGGHLSILPIALTDRAAVHVHAGELDAASALIEEAAAICEATGSAPLSYTSLLLAAWCGQESRALESIQLAMGDATVRGEGRVIGMAQYATAVLYNGLGRYEDALPAAQRACAYDDLGLFGWALAEVVEAGTRSHNVGVAVDAMFRLDERTQASGTDWALGIRAQSRALLSEGEAADALYREAIERLGRTRIAVHLARAQLLYGEWLRRENRRVDAREQLRAAHEMFGRIGAAAFAERAGRELDATGEIVPRRTAETRDDLTVREAQIVRLAAGGKTNVEIGAHLYISPRTVEYHLRKVFTKLGITSRRELRAGLSRTEPIAA